MRVTSILKFSTTQKTEKRSCDPSFADRVEEFCSSLTRVILAIFLLGLLVFELTRFAFWLIAG